MIVTVAALPRARGLRLQQLVLGRETSSRKRLVFFRLTLIQQLFLQGT